MSFRVVLQSMFDADCLAVFLICAFVLLFIDCKDYKKRGMSREYKAAKFFGLLFIFGGSGMFILFKFFIR